MNRLARRCVELLLLICILFIPRPTPAAGRVECNSIPSKILARSVPYCIVLPPSFDADKARTFPVLYFFHGLGDNEQFFVHSGAWNLVEDMRDKGELKDFLIATPDARSTFYINARDGKERYEDFLLQEFFPYVEKHYRVAAGRANRAISGISMGGYGASVPGVPPSTAFFFGKRSQCRADRKTADLSCWCAAEFAEGSRAGWRFWKSARSGFLASTQSHSHCTNREFSSLEYLF